MNGIVSRLPEEEVPACCNRTTFPPKIDIKAIFRSNTFRATPKLRAFRTMGDQMIRLFSSVMLLTVSVVGNALALDGVVAVPAPEIGGGMVGIMLATGVVYLINRRRSRS